MKRNNPKHLPETIKALRIILNYSQKYISSKLDVRQSTVSDIENGIISPCKNKLEIISDIYGLNSEELILLSQRPPRENMSLALEHLKHLDKTKPTRADFELFERLSNLRYSEYRKSS